MLTVPPVFTPAGMVEVAAVVAAVVAVVVVAAVVATVVVGELVVGLTVVDVAAVVATVVAALVVVVLLLLPQPARTRNTTRMRATGISNFFKLFLLMKFFLPIIY
jgi:hypothetical protein